MTGRPASAPDDWASRAWGRSAWSCFAKRLGAIPAARPLIEGLRGVGLYLDAEFVEDILTRIGE